MKVLIKFVVSFAVVISLVGCATSRSVLDIPPPSGQAGQPNNKRVFINSATDKRVFQSNPSSPDIPSLDPSEDASDKIKLSAIGRKRNGFGKALGDILLKEEQTVESLSTDAIKQAFIEKGYTVVSRKDISKDTYIVDADIEKFWSWMNPGFTAITLSTEISTNLNIQKQGSNGKQKISVKASDSYQIGTENNWIEIINKALRLYIDELKTKLE